MGISKHYLDTSGQIQNYKTMETSRSKGNLTVTEYSLQFLKDKGYFTDTLSEMGEDGKSVVTDLFISHPDARRLLRMFPNVVIMNSTYKTNRYGKPLLEFVGFTSTSHKYCIALVFMKQETTKHYTWALKRLKWLFGKKRPLCFMSDQEHGAIKGVQNVFGDVRHLLCQVHVDRSVKEYAKLMKVDPNRFSSSVRRVMRSHTEDEYEERLAHFRSKWNACGGGELVGYVESTWLIHHKEKLVCAWSDDILHFATRTSYRVEPQSSMLKDMLETCVGGLDNLVQHIDNMFVYQVCAIKDEMEKGMYMTTCDILEEPDWVKSFFSRLVMKVSANCLKILLDQVVKAKKGLISDEIDSRDRWWVSTMGLPSPKRIKIYVEENIPCPLADVDIFWKQIKWNGMDDNDDRADDDVIASYEHVKEKGAKGDKKTTRDKTREENVQVITNKEEKEKGTKGDRKTKGKTSPKATSNKSSTNSKAHPPTQSHSKDDSDCSFIGEHKAHQRVPQPSIIYLGFNWGSENIDSFILAYISSVHDVVGDGHCGYRALSVLAGYHEGMYPSMRFELSKFIQKDRPYWQLVIEDGGDINDFIMKINVVVTPCSRRYWMQVPIMGLVFATMHQVAVVVLTLVGPCTCLPLYALPGAEPPKTVIAIALIGSHFVPVWLVDDYCPIPPPPRQWSIYKQPTVDGWDKHPRFYKRFQMYRNERIASGKPPILN